MWYNQDKSQKWVVHSNRAVHYISEGPVWKMQKGVAVTDVMQIEAAKGEILGQLPPSTLPMTVPPAGNNSSSEDRYKL